MALALECDERAVTASVKHSVPDLVVPGQVTTGHTPLTMPNEGSIQIAVEQGDIVRHEVIIRGRCGLHGAEVKYSSANPRLLTWSLLPDTA